MPFCKYLDTNYRGHDLKWLNLLETDREAILRWDLSMGKVGNKWGVLELLRVGTVGLEDKVGKDDNEHGDGGDDGDACDGVGDVDGNSPILQKRSL